MARKPKSVLSALLNLKGCIIVLAGVCILALLVDQGAKADSENGEAIACANLIYAGTKSSRCFSDQFLHALSSVTTVETSRKFKPVKLSSSEIFSYPFAIMTGEDKFTLTDGERENLKRYLVRGGFLLASAGCSNKDWDEAFRQEIKLVFPDRELEDIPMDHPVYSMAYEIDRLETKEADAHLEGLSVGGKLVVIYSPDGLNDTGTMHGCCCCGGNEIKNSQQVNANIITYALLQ